MNNSGKFKEISSTSFYCNIYLLKGQRFYHTETSPSIHIIDQLTGVYMMAALNGSNCFSLYFMPLVVREINLLKVGGFKNM